jgi:hypothetical protein
MYIAKERNKSIAQVGYLPMLYWYSKYARSSSTTSNQVCGATGAVCNREQVPSLKGRELVMESRK